ncbi:hypothetical protein Tco_0145480 [Tanacetum coccineum]
MEEMGAGGDIKWMLCTRFMAKSKHSNYIWKITWNVEFTGVLLVSGGLVLEFGHPKVGLFWYLVAPDPLLPWALFPPPWEKKRKEEELELLPSGEQDIVSKDVVHITHSKHNALSRFNGKLGVGVGVFEKQTP